MLTLSVRLGFLCKNLQVPVKLMQSRQLKVVTLPEVYSAVLPTCAAVMPEIAIKP